MSVEDYTCTTMGCSGPAVAVFYNDRMGACYGTCIEHVRPLGGWQRWVHPPAASAVPPVVLRYDETSGALTASIGQRVLKVNVLDPASGSESRAFICDLADIVASCQRFDDAQRDHIAATASATSASTRPR